MARILFEVLSGSLEKAKFPGKNGIQEEVSFYQFTGCDVDYFDQMFKVKIYRPEQKTIEKFQQVKKGDQLNVKFKSMKRDDKYEKATIISVSESDVEIFEEKKEPVKKAA